MQLNKAELVLKLTAVSAFIKVNYLGSFFSSAQLTLPFGLSQNEILSICLCWLCKDKRVYARNLTLKLLRGITDNWLRGKYK